MRILVLKLSRDRAYGLLDKFLISVIILLFLSFYQGPYSAHADTYVNDTITENTTWDLSGSPYIIRNNLTVNAGAELTVQPGVKLVFNASQSNLSVGLYIYGTFVANNVDFSTAMGSGDIRVYDQGSADFIGCAFSGVIPINFVTIQFKLFSPCQK